MSVTVSAVYLPGAGAGQVAIEEIFNELARSRVGQGLAFVRPVFEIDEAARLGACRIEPANSANLRTVRSGSSDQKLACSTSIGRAPSSRLAACECRHMSCSAVLRFLRIKRETPRRRERDHALAIDEVRRRDRHRTPQAIANQRSGLANAAQQRQQQMFDVSGNVEFGALLRFTPVEEQRPPPHARDRSGQRHLLVEIAESAADL